MTFLGILDWVTIKTFLLLVVVFLVATWWVQKRNGLPPGPWRFPFIGYFPQLAWCLYRGEQLHDFTTRLGYKYGKLYSIDMLGQVFIVMNDFSIMREGNNNPLLSNKGHNSELEAALLGQHLHSCSHNAEYRKFALTSLRGFGIGKRGFEANIVIESKALYDELNALNGEPCNPHQLLVNTASNALFSVVFGQRYEYDDEKFKYLTDMNNKVLGLLGEGSLALLLPMIPMSGNVKNDLQKYTGELFKFIDERIDEHRESLDAENPRDFIDVYLKEMDSKPEPEDPASYLQKKNMRAALYLLFMAGADTASTTLKWCCLYMMGYPEIQQKIQEEMDSVVGRDRLPLISDQDHLPYTRAALLEIQRIIVLTPLSDFHTSSEETMLRGYRIPKSANIVSNLHAIMKDPDVFPDPDEFKPERFIDEDGKYFEREEVCPFGVGRRRCLGEHLAKMELFMFFTHLLHRFSLVKPDDTPSVSFEGVQSVTFEPKPFEVKFIPRD